MINLKNINAIIFDLGGVILNIDYQLTIDAFERLGIKDFKNQYSQAQQSSIFDLLETGRIEEDEFVQKINGILTEPIPKEKIIDAWNALLLDFPEKRLELLEKINRNYKTYLLSNTNAIHLKCYTNILHNSFGIDSLDPFFNKVYYSHELQLRKPEPDIFNHVLNENSLSPKSTLFIDDSIQHIETANNLGIRTHWLKTGEEITDLMSI